MAQTHVVTRSKGVLTKRYRTWLRGEPQREWSALTTLSAAAPDLVPGPLEAGLDADPPFVRMTILPGAPLDGALSERELEAMEVALRELWSIPPDGLRQVAPASWADLAHFRYLLIARRPPASGVAAEAHAAAAAWWDGPHVGQFATAGGEPVVGHGDPNLSNYLWDGTKVRIIDFEDAGRSDIELELANLVEHLSSRDTAWDQFVGRFRVDERRFGAARVFWASFWLTLLMPGGSSADRNPPGTLESQATRLLTLLDLC